MSRNREREHLIELLDRKVFEPILRKNENDYHMGCETLERKLSIHVYLYPWEVTDARGSL